MCARGEPYSGSAVMRASEELGRTARRRRRRAHSAALFAVEAAFGGARARSRPCAPRALLRRWPRAVDAQRVGVVARRGLAVAAQVLQATERLVRDGLGAAYRLEVPRRAPADDHAASACAPRCASAAVAAVAAAATSDGACVRPAAAHSSAPAAAGTTTSADDIVA